MPSNNSEIEKRLWESADESRANLEFRSSEYSTPVLGLVFLKWTGYKFSIAAEEFQQLMSDAEDLGKRIISNVDSLLEDGT